MIPDKFELARVTITFTSPMIVASGESTDWTDAVCIQDPNGYPTIPGTSLAGVLRSAYGNLKDSHVNEIFGSIDDEVGTRSKLSVGWGHLHNAHNQPVSHTVQEQHPDSVLDFALNGVHRDFVRINEYGTVDDLGKFEKDLVPVGARFTFWLLLDTASQQLVNIDTFIALLNHSSTRLGGMTRRGAGEFVVSRVQKDSFDLSSPADYARFSTVSMDVSVPWNVPDFELPNIQLPVSNTQMVAKCTAKDFLLPGGGFGLRDVFSKITDDELDQTKIHPVFERRIEWDSKKESGWITEPQFYIPSTAIKGVLRHRVLYYLRVLCGEWSGMETFSTADELNDCLFGTLLSQSNGGRLLPGSVYVSEPWLPADLAYRVVQHVQLDQFTQGPITGALFSEVVLESCQFDVTLHIDWNMFELQFNDANLENRLVQGESLNLSRGKDLVMTALKTTLQDLIKGRLALGGGASRGHGCLEGNVRIVGGAQ